MCGICGFTGQLEDRENILQKMTEVITHRGPDSEGNYMDDYIAMGFRRLSIIDLEGGDQPITNEDGNLVLTFNGEIYNYKDLRKELEEKGHTFKTNADSEVLVHGFEEWDEEMLMKLRGMFAFAIYNKDTKALFMARDFFGIKPLHYTMIGDGFTTWTQYEKSAGGFDYSEFSARAEKMASMIPDDVTSIMDMGCGDEVLRRYLDPRIRYYGLDIVRRNADTIVCDANADPLPDLPVFPYTLYDLTQTDFLRLLPDSSQPRISWLFSDVGKNAAVHIKDVSVHKIGR